MTTSPESDRPKYRRVLLKLSGESFATEGAFGIHPEELASIAGEIASAMREGLELAIVVGGGNIIRGAQLAAVGKFDQQWNSRSARRKDVQVRLGATRSKIPIPMFLQIKSCNRSLSIRKRSSYRHSII